jgi:hypothetical protein
MQSTLHKENSLLEVLTTGSQPLQTYRSNTISIYRTDLRETLPATGLHKVTLEVSCNFPNQARCHRITYHKFSVPLRAVWPQIVKMGYSGHVYRRLKLWHR